MAIFCFTDIEGSTEKWEKFKGVMGQVIARHNQILEANVAKFGGRVIKHTGDGIYAIFEEPAEALESALQIQREVQAETWPGIGELRVRMAFHCGEAEKMGGDYIGPVANRTARLMALGWGGQILVSDELKKIGALPAGATLQDLGVHQVKDLPEPQQVYGLIHPDLKLKEFPALKSLSRPNNLPPQLTPFIGRTAELASVAAFFKAPNSRLLTLRGSGGMGKTRLCIQAGLEGIVQFKHGVYFVALETLNAPDQIVPAIAAALKLSFYSDEDPKTQLLKYLHDKEMLLILDNYDHLLAGAGLLSDMLLAAPLLKLLVSSRSKLNHNSESVLEIQGLDEAGAVKLFIQRARKVKLDFELKAEEKELLTRICAQLEGMPLGLELAAAWVKTISLKEICRRLDTSIGLLVSSEKDLPERQRSMRALFDYSWKFLSPDEQKIFRNLSVFIEGFSGDAAEKVAQCNHANLSALVNKSLLKVGEHNRYFVHETLRQFARAKLDQLAPEKQRIQDLHCHYYFQFLKSREVALKGAGQAPGMAEIARDFGNIRQAWKYALSRRMVKAFALGARCLGIYAEIMCLGAEWKPLMEQALALWGGSDSTAFEGCSQDEALKAFATLQSIVTEWQFNSGELGAPECARALEKSVQLFKKVQVKEEVAWCLLRLGGYATTEAVRAASLNEAAAIYRLGGDKNGEAIAKAGLGQQLWRSGQNPEGKRMLSEAMALLKETGNARDEARALLALGDIALEEGKTEEGVQRYQAATDLFARLGDREEAGWAMAKLGGFFMRASAWKEAARFNEGGLSIFESLRHDRGAQACFKNLSEIHWATGDMARALQSVDRALAYAGTLKGGDLKRGRAFMEKAEILQRQGSLEEALATAESSLKIMQGAQSAAGAAEAMELQGDICLGLVNPGRARELFKGAHLAFSQMGPEWRSRKAWSYVKMADAEAASSQGAEARRNYGRTLSMAEAAFPEDFGVAALKGLAMVLAKEKKQLDALRLLIMCDRMAGDEKMAIGRPRVYDKARQEGAQLLAEMSSKLLQNVVDESRIWAKGMALAPFYKETVAKYCV